jgi:CelD/BcsL family acetyltransferase involved in cellulose biosynthesis
VSHVRLRRVALPDAPWPELERHRDRTVFQTRPWLDFLAETQGAEPVVAEVRRGDDVVGWFTGAVVRRFGFRILGSPLPGWATSYMGFDLDVPIEGRDLLDGLRRFAFASLRCAHLELMDRAVPVDAAPVAGYRMAPFCGYELALAGSDEQLLDGMTRSGRRDVRRALRNGIEVEEVDPEADPGFASEYYGQVAEAFAKRGLAPTYGVDRVEAAIRHLHPAGDLLLLRARTADGRPAATGLFPGHRGGTAFYWMGGSHRSLQALLPNEALMWHAIRTWRDRGAVRFDFGGGGAHKAKYGGRRICVPWWRADRLGALEVAREAARRAARLRQRAAGPPRPADPSVP